MMFAPARMIRRTAVTMAACVGMMGISAVSAQARVFVGVGLGFPFYGPAYLPPPVYYPPPPVYYPPPPVYYTPPQPQTYSPAPLASGAGQACYAGPYVCPMDRPVASGASCYCAGNGGQRIWGRAN